MSGIIPRSRAFWAILAAAAAVRVAYARTHPGIYDIDYYVTFALSVLKRGEYAFLPGVPSVQISPLFPLWIASLFFVFGEHPFLILLANCALSVATGVILYLLGRRLFSERAGLIALALWAVYPYAIYYCAWTYRESFLVFLAVAMVWLLTEFFDRQTDLAAAAAGVCGGLMGLANPSGLIFIGLSPLALMLRDARASRPRLLAVFYLCLGLSYSPWVVRNYLAFRKPIVTNLHGGMNLYYGVMIPSDDLGTEREVLFRKTDPLEKQAEELFAAGRESEANELYKAASRREIRRAPLHYLRTCFDRFVKFWRFVPYRRAYGVDYSKLFWASLLSDGLFIPLGLAGFLVFRRRWRELLPLSAIVLLWPSAYYLVYAIIRFRMPVMPVLILMTAALVDFFLQEAGAGKGWRENRRST
jgi:4-amino-4-deoxy-L-arabinose transferase-like glycosyltransferase